MTESTFSIGGLVSGLDFNQLVDQLMEIERRPVQALDTRRVVLEQELSAFQEFKTRLLGLRDAADALNRVVDFQKLSSRLSSSNPSLDAEDVLSVSLSDEASPGTFDIEVTTLAEAQSISSGSFTDSSSALGLSGTILINGQAIDIVASDTLADVREKVNNSNSGATPSLVTATILTVSETDHRLILTSSVEGAEGISILDASSDASNLLQALGFTTSGEQIKNQDGALVDSDTFANMTTAVGTLLDLSSPNSGTIQIKGEGIAIDLSTDSLSEISDAINEKSGTTGVTASVEAVTEDGVTLYKLQLTGVAGVGDFTDDENILETLGIIEGVLADELNAGVDAEFTVNGSIDVTRSSNTVDDLVEGVTLNLLASAPGTTITVHVERDLEEVRKVIDNFVDAYNDLQDFVEEQQAYDEETEVGGPLQGDAGMLAVRSSVHEILGKTFPGLDTDYDTLAEVGLSIDKEGRLELDGAILTAAMGANFKAVRSVFVGEGTATSSDVRVIAFGKVTEPGTYAVNITQAATQSSVTGTQDLGSGIASDTSITITDDATGRSATVNLTTGDDIDDIVSKINSELQAERTEVLTGSASNTDSSTGLEITDATLFQNVSGANVQDGDTIDFTGTDRLGNSISGSFTVESAASATIRDFLSAIEESFSNGVIASVNSSGRIVITDVAAGDSALTLTITENNEGGGSLDFGTITETTTGRYAIEITASKDAGDQLVLTSDAYGSDGTFDVTDSDVLGIYQTNMVDGVDVEGTINGESATGNGQILVGDDDQPKTAGLHLRILGSATGDRGTVTLSFGAAERVFRTLHFATDIVDGIIPSRIRAVQRSIDYLGDRMELMEDRLDRKREQLIKKFVRLETTLARLQTQSVYLANLFMTSSLIGSLGGGST